MFDYHNYLNICEQVKELQKAKIGLEVEMYKKHSQIVRDNEEGLTKIVDGDYTVKITRKINRTVNQDIAEELGGFGLKTKYSWSKAEFDKLSPLDKKVMAKAITEKPGKPSFDVEINL
ncbi:MAG: hypothetical protein DRQ88_09235 [Epsilonproteobacteria bacterium]|nr:MAG: hypothetical protein DRQ88_09235 [Campylobacterota bacterium]